MDRIRQQIAEELIDTNYESLLDEITKQLNEDYVIIPVFNENIDIVINKNDIIKKGKVYNEGEEIKLEGFDPTYHDGFEGMPVDEGFLIKDSYSLSRNFGFIGVDDIVNITEKIEEHYKNVAEYVEGEQFEKYQNAVKMDDCQNAYLKTGIFEDKLTDETARNIIENL